MEEIKNITVTIEAFGEPKSGKRKDGKGEWIKKSLKSTDGIWYSWFTNDQMDKLFEGVKIGDSVDVLAKPREYNGKTYWDLVTPTKVVLLEQKVDKMNERLAKLESIDWDVVRKGQVEESLREPTEEVEEPTNEVEDAEQDEIPF